jgi:hypothetical protein
LSQAKLEVEDVRGENARLRRDRDGEADTLRQREQVRPMKLFSAKEKRGKNPSS